MTNAVMGIDPGVRGGVAVLHGTGMVVYRCAFRPDFTIKDLDLVIKTAVEFLQLNGGNNAFLEKVGSLPRDGHVGAFTFGRVVGILAEAVIARGVQLHEVPPVIWQSHMECLTGGNKNISKKRAQELFPDEVKITHALADALLISEYGRRSLCLSVV